MNYFEIFIVIVSIFNFAVAIACLKQLRTIKEVIKEAIVIDQQPQNVHEDLNVQNVLNNRLLDLQSRKYAVQRIKS